MTTRSVPCHGCTACCEHDIIMLHPECGDIVASYEHEPMVNPVTGAIGFALKHRPDGACIYLVDGVGCSIHERAPAICREFDCRLMVLRFKRPELRRLIREGLLGSDVVRAGRARLGTLPVGEWDKVEIGSFGKVKVA